MKVNPDEVRKELQKAAKIDEPVVQASAYGKPVQRIKGDAPGFFRGARVK